MGGGHEELTTDRLFPLRPTEDDVDVILAIHRDPATCVHNPRTPSPPVPRPRSSTAAGTPSGGRHGFGYWTVREHNSPSVLGFCGVKPMAPAGRPALNLFYRLAPAARGRAVATEAATAVTAWASAHVPTSP